MVCWEINEISKNSEKFTFDVEAYQRLFNATQISQTQKSVKFKNFFYNMNLEQ